MADNRSSAEIERDIERERAELASTVDELTDRFSMDRMVRETQAYLRENGGELSTNAMRTIRETPIAALLTVVGLGWMMMGNQNRRVVEYRDRPGTPPTRGGYVGGTPRGTDHDSTAAAGSAYGASEALGPRETTAYGASDYRTASPAYASGSTGTAGGFAGGGSDDDFDARVAAADARMRSEAAGTTGLMSDDRAAFERYEPARDTVSRDYSAYKRDDEDDDSVFERVSDQAQDLWHQTVAAVRTGYRSTMAGAQNTYNSAYRSATELRDRLIEGTEGMDSAGRERVAQARARAYQAQLRAQTMAQRGSQRTNDFFHEQPLVAGAIAMAVGAAIGGALPRTRREDEAFGVYRDQLFDDAEAVFQEERMRAEAAGRAALSEASKIGEEAKDSVLGKTPDGRETVREAESQARTAADRVADAARRAHESGSASTTS